jgi:hypothetical protein
MAAARIGNQDVASVVGRRRREGPRSDHGQCRRLQSVPYCNKEVGAKFRIDLENGADETLLDRIPHFNERIFVLNPAVLRLSTFRTPAGAAKLRHQSRIQRPALHARLPSRHNLFERHSHLFDRRQSGLGETRHPQCGK